MARSEIKDSATGAQGKDAVATPTTTVEANDEAKRTAYAKSVVRILFFSLVLDLLSFTLILPLFPRLLDFYREKTDSVALNSVLASLNSYKAVFSRPISARFDVVLLGGAMGSLFSFLQAFASPIIGALSDKYGRRTALLYSMLGNIISVSLWVVAYDFPTFLASRVVGGLSEGNVQLAIAIATDVSTPQTRGSTLALVGIAFSVAFTFGPIIGAILSQRTFSTENPFAVAASFSLALLVIETVFLWFKLPETRPVQTKKPTGPPPSTKGLKLLSFIHFLFLFIFSGMEFSLPFMTYDLFNYTSKDNGKLLGFVGLLAATLQGSFTRRAPARIVVNTGLASAAISFFLLARIDSQKGLYLAATFLAVTSANVVTGLTALTSMLGGEHSRGRMLGGFRSAGQIGRAMGPIAFCTLYWWAGRETAYTAGGIGMVGVASLFFFGLPAVQKVEGEKEKKKGATSGEVKAK
ncbi:major facilitator superfamily domain-containing protein [Peziza echinospora]|nr:major facilitator superfamily domain-containing protein [Peziza echinospora]